MTDTPTGPDDELIRPELIDLEPARGSGLPHFAGPRQVRLRTLTARTRRFLLPAALFLVTCVSTFWAGAAVELAPLLLLKPQLAPKIVELGWSRGLAYMALVMCILLAHEMGHFLQTLRYRVPATLPLFLPMPISLIGTMGAVIAMRSVGANRKQLFDIGLSGPWAGLLIALPVICIGILKAEPFPMDHAASIHYPDPLLVKGLMRWLRGDLLPGQELTMNPFLMAGWVALLITGLNMLPIGQLDGGHVAYALFGNRAHWLARAVALFSLIMIMVFHQFGFGLMFFLVLLMGVRHPPTSNDHIALGWPRRLIGIASLAIPVLCLAPLPEFGWTPPGAKPVDAKRVAVTAPNTSLNVVVDAARGSVRVARSSKRLPNFFHRLRTTVQSAFAPCAVCLGTVIHPTTVIENVSHATTCHAVVLFGPFVRTVLPDRPLGPR